MSAVQTHTESLSYRPDIDGLRAVAVLSVVGYHAFPNWGRGGFVGVDIFFVISGYLISSIIFKGYAGSTFSFLDFYERRIRRIFPALILVLLSCLLFAALAAFPATAYQIGKHTVAGVFFSSNWVLLSEAGYFDGASDLKPLLHLWSLSVEEQYYLVWPILIALVQRKPHRWLVLILGLLAASFVLNVALIGAEPSFVFFTPVTRAWELLLGSLLAYVHFRAGESAAAFALGPAESFLLRCQRWVELHRDAVGWCGAVLLLAGLVGITTSAKFPGWWALLPTLGSFCVIAAGSGAWFNRKVLACGPATFFGRISYPLYLWHWPLLVFLRIAEGEVSRVERLAAVGISIALAYLTYRYVEKAIRFGARGLGVVLALIASMLLIAALGVAFMLSDGWVHRYPADVRNVAVADIKFDYSDYRSRRCFLDPEQGPQSLRAECMQAKQPNVPELWLWGDSHAASESTGLLSLSEQPGNFTFSQFTASACPPVIGFAVADRPHCRAFNDVVLEKITQHPPDVLVMSANWTLYNGEVWERLNYADLAATIERVKALGVKRVVLIGQLPRWLENQPLLIMKRWRESGAIDGRSSKLLNPKAAAVEDRLRSALAQSDAFFFSPMAELCNQDGCEMTVTTCEGVFPIAWDDSHLTPQASKFLLARWKDTLLTGTPVKPVMTQCAAQGAGHADTSAK
jgi:peptidoglycan/LPS O-acetylase OafA/YrhL